LRPAIVPAAAELPAMPSFGYSLMCELYDPNELLAQAARAEAAGFDFVTISDHFHPWLFSHHHSPYAWSVLGALAAQTERVELVSLVTCPTIRYHPAIVAQKAATVAVMSDGRFRLGVGAGENLNEHVVGRGWPPVQIRHEMLEEAIEIIRALWGGGYYAHQGKHPAPRVAATPWSMVGGGDDAPSLRGSQRLSIKRSDTARGAAARQKVGKKVPTAP
jgi:G6PDH family F420-dependent oxidoreductase